MTDESSKAFLAKEIQSFLNLKRDIVGVKIISDEETPDYEMPTRKISYCEAVSLASSGKKIIISKDTAAEMLYCLNPIVTLGFEEPAYIDLQPRISPASTTAILLCRLADWDYVHDPDVVIIIGDAKQVSDVAEAVGGIDVKVRGGIAVCGDLTAFPFMEKRAALSVLCGGARLRAGFASWEAGVGLPFSILQSVAERFGKRRHEAEQFFTSD